ncbi:hypothetical protein J7M00_05840 [bacterium]|nr:hypothetical protein [bacterium]
MSGQNGSDTVAVRRLEGQAERLRTEWERHPAHREAWMVKRKASLILLERGIFQSFRLAQYKRQQGATSNAPRSVEGEAERFF